jgi:hypothetical protein
METDYNALYETVTVELQDLRSQKTALEKEIARKRQFLVSLGRMLGKPASTDSPQGPKGAILEVLQAANEPLTPAEIVSRAKELGYSFTASKNPMPPVVATLKRMVDSGEAVAMQWLNNRTAYRWAKAISEPEDVMQGVMRRIVAQNKAKK